jgi:hypothetical protein
MLEHVLISECMLALWQSSESLRSSWNKKLKVTSQHPFKLRTEVITHPHFFSVVTVMFVNIQSPCFLYDDSKGESLRNSSSFRRCKRCL